MLTQSSKTIGDVRAARKVYDAIKHIHLAQGNALEAHERIALLTVPAGLRSFCWLTQLGREDLPFAEAILTSFGLTVGTCNSTVSGDLSVAAPADVVEAYWAWENRSPFCGLGVANGRVDLEGCTLGTALCYPLCCIEMDEATKSYDRSKALQMLIDAKGCDWIAVKAELERGGGAPTPHTDRRNKWDLRFAQTHEVFPFALHTACDECLSAGDKSPSGVLSRQYSALVRAVSSELFDAVVRQNEAFRRTSRSTQ